MNSLKKLFFAGLFLARISLLQATECPADSGLEAYGRLGTLSKLKGPALKKGVTDLEALGQQCPDHADVQVVLAQAWMAFYRFPEAPEADRASTRNAFRLLSSVWKKLLAIETMLPPLQNAPLLLQLRVETAQELLKMADTANLVHPYIAQQGAAQPCFFGAGSLAQILWTEYEKLPGGYTPLFLKRLAQSCQGEPTLEGRKPSLIFGKLLAQQGIRVQSDRSSRSFAEAAWKALHKYVGPGPVGSTQKDVLQEPLLQVAFLLSQSDPVRELFVGVKTWSPLERLRRVAQVGFAIDAVWQAHPGEDSESEKVRIQEFKVFLTKLYAQAQAAGEGALGVLVEGLRGHAQKVFRGPQGTRQDSPPQQLWTWIPGAAPRQLPRPGSDFFPVDSLVPTGVPRAP